MSRKKNGVPKKEESLILDLIDPLKETSLNDETVPSTANHINGVEESSSKEPVSDIHY